MSYTMTNRYCEWRKRVLLYYCLSLWWNIVIWSIESKVRWTSSSRLSNKSFICMYQWKLIGFYVYIDSLVSENIFFCENNGLFIRSERWCDRINSICVTLLLCSHGPYVSGVFGLYIIFINESVFISRSCPVIYSYHCLFV